MRTAVILMTHRFDDAILDEFQRIRAGIGASDQAFLLSDGSAPTPAALAAITHVFDYATVARRAARPIGRDILRNVHLAWIDFFEAHPDFDAYWLIEYDVVYSGPWREVFDAFRDQPHDLLCCHLRTYDQEPGWYWWPEIIPPGRVGPVRRVLDRLPDPGWRWWRRLFRPGPALPRDRLVRGFLPIARFSRRGFVCLRDAVDEGWCGFMEGLIPTLIQSAGLRLGDLGGDGPYVPDGFGNRFYGSVSDPAGSMTDLGSMRYRPPILYPRILPGRLYHPVKPGPDTFDAGVDQPRLARAALDRAMRKIRALASAADAPADRAEGDSERQLQIHTGLSAPELRQALDRMAADGDQDPAIATLRQELDALAAARSHPARSR